jgi:hypothetical protein
LVPDFSWWFCRYLAEFKSGAERKEAAESTMNAYKAAQVGYLMKTNPILCACWYNGIHCWCYYLCCRILPSQIWLRPTPSGLDLRSTSRCSTMRSWTPLTVLATLPSRSASAPFVSLYCAWHVRSRFMW